MNIKMIFLQLLLFLNLCVSAHAETSVSIVVNEISKKAKVTAKIDFYPPTAERLQEVVSVYTDVALQNQISDEKRRMKSFPKSLIKTKMSRYQVSNQEFNYYTSVGVPLYKMSIGLVCDEVMVDAKRWTQICDMLPDYKDTSDFADEVKQNNICELNETSVRCVFISEGVSKDFELGVVASLFGANAYSHTQMSMMGIESFLEGIFTSQIYLELKENQKYKTVERFSKSSQKKWIESFMAQMPEVLDESPVVRFSEKLQK